ncbi:MAG: hypothetical protein ACOCU1_02290 [Bacillota bacterium]
MKTYRIPRSIGFACLLLFVFILLLTTLINLANQNISFFIVLSFFTLLVGLMGFTVFKTEVLHQSTTINMLSVQNMIAVMIGSVLTYILHYFVGCPVLAASIIGLLGGFFMKPFGVPIYTGAFVGMSSAALFGIWPFLLATTLAAIIYAIAQDIFNGFGGKLGTIALSGAIISTVIFRGDFTSGTPFNLTEQYFIIGLSIAAAVLTYLLNIRFKLGPVIASALIGFIGGMILPLLTREFAHLYAVIIIGASFIGMSSKMRFKNVFPIAFAGVLYGLIFIYNAPYFGGAGGKLGTIALTSVLSIKGFMLLKDKFSKKQC